MSCQLSSWHCLPISVSAIQLGCLSPQEQPLKLTAHRPVVRFGRETLVPSAASFSATSSARSATTIQ
jgi:hypothetical protein